MTTDLDKNHIPLLSLKNLSRYDTTKSIVMPKITNMLLRVRRRKYLQKFIKTNHCFQRRISQAEFGVN